MEYTPVLEPALELDDNLFLGEPDPAFDLNNMTEGQLTMYLALPFICLMVASFIFEKLWNNN